MEINPLVIKNGKVYILDLAAKIDQVRVNNRCYKYKRNYSRLCRDFVQNYIPGLIFFGKLIQ